MSEHLGKSRKGIATGIVSLLMGAALLGCQSATAPQADLDAGKVIPPVLQAGQWIGADGGFLQMGSYSLEIPANAVSQRTFIEMEQISAGDWPVELSPHGIQFKVPVTLSMNASDQEGVESLGIHWWNPESQLWERQPSDVENGVVSAHLTHFSRYSLF
jgi:hypothetical protein